MSHVKDLKITSSDGSSIQLQSDGQIWMSEISSNRNAFSSPGYIRHGYCNLYKLLGIDKKFDDYFGVDAKLLKYGHRFKIKKLRILYTTVTDTKRGQLMKVVYGYVPVERFSYLRKNRKSTFRWTSGGREVILLKHSDMEWHSK